MSKKFDLLLKFMGEATVMKDGRKQIWIWDYKHEKPVLKYHMPEEQLEANDELRAEYLKKYQNKTK